MQAFIGMGLAIGKTAERGHPDYGTPLGNAQKLDTAQAVWNIFTAFGSMAFAYSYVSTCPSNSFLPSQQWLSFNYGDESSARSHMTQI